MIFSKFKIFIWIMWYNVKQIFSPCDSGLNFSIHFDVMFGKFHDIDVQLLTDKSFDFWGRRFYQDRERKTFHLICILISFFWVFFTFGDITINHNWLRGKNWIIRKWPTSLLIKIWLLWDILMNGKCWLTKAKNLDSELVFKICADSYCIFWQ